MIRRRAGSGNLGAPKLPSAECGMRSGVSRATKRLATALRPPQERGSRVTYRIDPDSTGSWMVTHVESGRRTSYGGSREWVEASVQDQQAGEDAMREALVSGDPFEPCRLGWHSGLVPVARRPTWFRQAAGKSGSLLIFRVANAPFEWAARTVWCHGTDANPWCCDACGREIPEQ